MKLEEKGLRVGEKQLKSPDHPGGMGVGISLGRLAGSVAKEGAVGIISAAQIGYQEPDFDTDARKANLRAIGKEMEKARAISPDGIIGFNIMVAMRHYEDYVREAVRAGTDLIIRVQAFRQNFRNMWQGVAYRLHRLSLRKNQRKSF